MLRLNWENQLSAQAATSGQKAAWEPACSLIADQCVFFGSVLKYPVASAPYCWGVHFMRRKQSLGQGFDLLVFRMNWQIVCAGDYSCFDSLFPTITVTFERKTVCTGSIIGTAPQRAALLMLINALEPWLAFTAAPQVTTSALSDFIPQDPASTISSDQHWILKLLGYNFQGDAEQNCKQMDELKILTLMQCQKFQHVSKVDPQFWISYG